MFEYLAGISVFDEYFIGDTTLDYVMDIVGVTVGYGIVKRMQALEAYNTPLE